MKLQKGTPKNGFSIIEVVLVLAIAGLIFLIVFLAVPALQKSQRDTQRRSDVGRLLTQVNNYAANSQGQLPSDTLMTDNSANGFLAKYLRIGGEQFSDPRAGTYTLVTAPSATYQVPQYAGDPDGRIHYRAGTKCGADGAFDAAGARSMAFILPLERGGYTCVSL